MQNLESATAPAANTSSNNEILKETTFKPHNFYSFTLEGLEKFLKQYGKEKFRAQQIFKWVYEQRVTDFDQMLNLSKDLRIELKKLITFE